MILANKRLLANAVVRVHATTTSGVHASFSNLTNQFFRETDYPSCSAEWKSFYRKEKDFIARYYSTEIVSRTTTEIYESIQSFGPGTVYTTCDGIPRFKFTGPVTSRRKQIVTITKTKYELNSHRLDAHPSEAATPGCTFPSSICRRINTIADLGSSQDNEDVDYMPSGHMACAYWDGLTPCELVVGEEAVLLYWPENLSRDICAENGYGSATTLPRLLGPSIFSTDAITFRGQNILKAGRDPIAQLVDNFNSSVLRGSWTFTSPTIYLAHHAVTAYFYDLGYAQISDSVSTRSIVRTAGVSALAPEDLFSIRPIHRNSRAKDWKEYARLVAEGSFVPNTTDTSFIVQSSIYPFDFMHIRDPVPASLYFDAREEDCWGRQSHCGTITDDSYRPPLYIKRRVWESMFPSSVACLLPHVVDPPIVLHPLGGPLDVPKVPGPEPTPASPALHDGRYRPPPPYPGLTRSVESPAATARQVCQRDASNCNEGHRTGGNRDASGSALKGDPIRGYGGVSEDFRSGPGKGVKEDEGKTAEKIPGHAGGLWDSKLGLERGGKANGDRAIEKDLEQSGGPEDSASDKKMKEGKENGREEAEKNPGVLNNRAGRREIGFSLQIWLLAMLTLLLGISTG